MAREQEVEERRVRAREMSREEEGRRMQEGERRVSVRDQ
jgi:hypothetical protein